MDEYIVGALRAGASGFLLKDAAAADLSQPSRPSPTATRSSRPPSRAGCSTQVARRLPAAVEPRRRRAPKLTAREREVLAPASPAGCSTRRSPQALVVSEPTVKTHVSHVLSKLGLRDRVQAVIYAYENGLVSP